ncbi:MAG: TonB-dependent receptor [Gammaproteobacteria bacterium]|nr:TonB-dependent receptor [Gammaproteobacteria bacterium]
MNLSIKRILISCAGVVFATQAGAAEIEEIVVTATKRGETDIQSIAGVIHAISGDELDEKGIIDFEDFAGAVPGLQFQDLGPGDKEYIIRGINGNGPAVVGTYFDEYVITANDQQDGGGKNAPIKLVDLERVEILNGPQGTLYGANSMAGNIKFIPRKPSADEFGAFFDSDLSGTEEGGFNYTLSGAVNVPLVQNLLALRAVGWRTDADGWIDQPRLQSGPTSFGPENDINDEETNGGRVLLRWTPTDRWTLDAMYLRQDLETGGSPRFTASGVPAWSAQPPEIAALPGNPGFAPLPGLQPLTPAEDFVNADITANTRDDDVELFGGTVQFDADFGVFTASASHYDHDIEFVFDSTPILLAFDNLFGLGGIISVPAITVEPQSYETTMVEGRFASSFDGPFNFVAGVYYQKDENDFEVHVTTTDGQGGAVPWDPLDANDAFLAGGTAVFGRFRQDEIEQKAVFGEATFRFMERWELLAGFRYFDSDLESVNANLHNFFGGSNTPAGEIIGTTVNGNGVGLIEESDDTIRPKVSLSYDVSDDALVYVLYSEGFRVGGVNNANQPFAAGIPATFSSDELQNLEFGVKSRWLDNRLQLNSTVFLIDWDNIQVEPRDPLGNIPFTTNGGAADVNGIEWAIRYLALENLELDFSGTYFFDHELAEDQPVLPGASPFVIVGLEGDEIPNVPEVQLFASAKYDTRIMDMPLSLIADLTYRDDTNTEFRPADPFNIELDSYVIVNLFANLQVNEQFSVGAYIKNVGDELAVYDGIGTFQDPESIVAARPRTFGATLSWRY